MHKIPPPKMLALVAFLITIEFSVAHAQIPVARPSPPSDTSREDVVRISTELIRIDVTVTDRRGRIVNDLKPEEFEVFENGRRQKVTGLTFVSAIRERTENAAPAPEDGDPVPPEPIRPENIQRTIAVVVDDLTLSFESVYQVRRALTKFVKEQMQQGDLVAIIRTAGGMGALQQFTTDKRMLLAAIDKIKWNPLGSGGVSAFAPIEATALEQAAANGADISDELLDSEADLVRGDQQFRANLFATGSLGAVTFVVNGMSALPGRKSILLLSDGFALTETSKDGIQDAAGINSALRTLVDRANRAAVVIHTLDARGLQAVGFDASDNANGLSPQEIRSRLNQRSSQLFNTQSGLAVLAEETGGTSIRNNNDLGWGIRKILEDQSYYLVSYEPDGDTFDPKTRRFNRLDVSVTRPDLLVRYRSGFFGVDDREISRPGLGSTRDKQLANALTSPFGINDISVRYNAIFNSEAKIGPYIRSFIHVDADGLTFKKDSDGKWQVVLELLAVAFGDNGIVADQFDRSLTISLSETSYNEILRTGITFDFVFAMKKPGPYQMRIAIRDPATEKLGSANIFVEVPNLKKKNLTISGIALESMSFEQWQAVHERSDTSVVTDPIGDTAIRRFTVGSVLNYGGKLLNVRSKAENVSFRARVFRDSKLVFESKPQTPDSAMPGEPGSFGFSGTLNLGTALEPGEYALQIVATEKISNKNRRLASQFVTFELVGEIANPPN